MKFIDKHSSKIQGLLHGFDRIIFRGYLDSFFSEKGMYYYLSKMNVKLTGYHQFMNHHNDMFRAQMRQLASEQGVQVHYLNNSKASKEQLAKKDLGDCPTKKGLISIISALEVSKSFRLRSNKEKKELEVVNELRQHLHYYLYYNDEEFGWMHLRIQSWYPFTIQIYVNAKEYLKGCLDKAQIGYEAYENSLTWVEHLEQAQEFADKLVQKKWDRFFNAFAKRVNPFLEQIESVFQRGYKWCIHQCEYATDVLFNQRQVLESLYPGLIQQATYFKGGEDIYTFFGRNLTHRSTKQVTGSTKRFEQGFRVKHYLDRNSVKMYDKYSVLRVETTINNSRAFKIYQEALRQGNKTMAWVPMGKAVSNLYRYAQIAKQCNLRYLNSLSHLEPPRDMTKNIERLSRPTSRINKNNNQVRFAALNLLSQQTSLILEAINDGKFALQAFSNKQLRKLLLEKGLFNLDPHDPKTLKKLSGKITRLIAKLRAHNILKKIARSFRYQLTTFGQFVCNKILQFKKFELVGS